MSILLDTNVFLWGVGIGGRLSESATEILDDPDTPIFFSAACAWEIAIKWSQGRLDLPEHPAEVVRNAVTTGGLTQLAITMRDAAAVAKLPFHHKDPFDRLLVAQARNNGLRLMTADPVLEKYDVDVIALWLDEDDE
ncbi:MAG TPA: type II toxin-antitoxin system VapC family toxin [Pyrinomonadaceae bacterium]|nr:type II toxin-antitoxin system VapC family toxin [Pyrinomonadaceae bacterium]